MNNAEFDQLADEYDAQHRANIAITGEYPDYFAEYKIRLLTYLINDKNFEAHRILDFGSGIGNSIPHFGFYFPEAHLVCADVSQRSLDIAQKRFPGCAEGLVIEGNRIPVCDDAFDIAFSACVFHHVMHDEHVHWLRELHRATRVGGHLVIFEHNPLNPLTLHAVNTCRFDANAHLLRAKQLTESCRQAGWEHPRTRYHLFFPRWLSALRRLEPRLTGLPLGAQYSVLTTKLA